MKSLAMWCDLQLLVNEWGWFQGSARETKLKERTDSNVSSVKHRMLAFVHQILEQGFMHPSNRTRNIVLVFSGNRLAQPKSLAALGWESPLHGKTGSLERTWLLWITRQCRRWQWFFQPATSGVVWWELCGTVIWVFEPERALKGESKGLRWVKLFSLLCFLMLCLEDRALTIKNWDKMNCCSDTESC